jgi:hypothetical protein
MSPKLIAKMVIKAVKPSAIVALSNSNVVWDPLASCRRPLAVLNSKTPGIIDTTAAKPMAANGMCQRRATGVRISPTIRQATKAPVAALEPSTVSVTRAVAIGSEGRREAMARGLRSDSPQRNSVAFRRTHRRGILPACDAHGTGGTATAIPGRRVAWATTRGAGIGATDQGRAGGWML